ncbi:MAG: hypothetical protein JO270_03025 [Acidobacteriaceae bacterium]|nr:hypothetical protein [Acidobacteriaceae bacterium]
MRRESISLILTDFVFTGIFPLLLGPREERPPIISVSVSPLVLTSVDASPFGPINGGEEKEETARFQASLSSVNDYVNELLRGAGSRPLPGFFIDCFYMLPFDGLTRMKSLSQMWCLPEGVGCPPGKVSSSISTFEIWSVSIQRQPGRGRLLEPRTCRVNSLMTPLWTP